MAAATWAPWASATASCSTRMRRPCTVLSYSQMSPAAYRSGAEVCRRVSHFTPPDSPSDRPAALASITSGFTPVPSTTRSASSSSPAAVTTSCTRPSPSNRSSCRPPRNSIPCPSSRPRIQRPTAGPKPPSIGSSSCITTVTFLPMWVREAATSQPMYEPPTTTTRSACSASSRMDSALPSART